LKFVFASGKRRVRVFKMMLHAGVRLRVSCTCRWSMRERIVASVGGNFESCSRREGLVIVYVGGGEREVEVRIEHRGTSKAWMLERVDWWFTREIRGRSRAYGGLGRLYAERGAGV
jgi:hypothetical protein